MECSLIGASALNHPETAGHSKVTTPRSGRRPCPAYSRLADAVELEMKACRGDKIAATYASRRKHPGLWAAFIEAINSGSLTMAELSESTDEEIIDELLANATVDDHTVVYGVLTATLGTGGERDQATAEFNETIIDRRQIDLLTLAREALERPGLG